MATTVARLEAILSANTRDFDRAMGRSEKRMKKVGAAAKVGLGIGVAAGIAVLKNSVSAAMDAERAQARLERSFKANVKGGIEPFKKKIEEASTAAINLGFDDEALKDSLGSLVVATRDYGEAQRLSNIAMDIARFKGVDLEQATKMLTMAMAGSQRATKQLGLDIPRVTDAYDKLKVQFRSASSEGGKVITASEKLSLQSAKLTDKQRTAGVVIETVSRKVKGQADAYRKTAEGEMAVFSAKLEELQEKLGEKVLPVLSDVVEFLNKMIDSLEKVDKWMSKIGADKSLIEIFDALNKRHPGIMATLNDIAHAFRTIWGWINKVIGGIKWIIDNIGKLGGALGKIPGVGRLGGGQSESSTGLIPMVQNAVGAAREMGWRGRVTSGFRTYQEQSALYQRYLAGGPLAAAPGTSSHEKGQAVDVTDYTTFGRMMSRLPHGLRLYNKLGARDPVHFSVSGYAKGGTVPGPIGMPQLAVVHGGETITPPGGEINLYIDGHKLFTWFRNEKQRRSNRGEAF